MAYFSFIASFPFIPLYSSSSFFIRLLSKTRNYNMVFLSFISSFPTLSYSSSSYSSFSALFFPHRRTVNRRGGVRGLNIFSESVACCGNLWWDGSQVHLQCGGQQGGYYVKQQAYSTPFHLPFRASSPSILSPPLPRPHLPCLPHFPAPPFPCLPFPGSHSPFSPFSLCFSSFSLPSFLFPF